MMGWLKTIETNRKQYNWANPNVHGINWLLRKMPSNILLFMWTTATVLNRFILKTCYRFIDQTQLTALSPNIYVYVWFWKLLVYFHIVGWQLVYVVCLGYLIRELGMPTPIRVVSLHTVRRVWSLKGCRSFIAMSHLHFVLQCLYTWLEIRLGVSLSFEKPMG